MNKKKTVKSNSRYYPPELMPFVWCTSCLSVVLEQSDEANDIFEEIIDCLDLPRWKATFEKVENELPGGESLLKQMVKESGFDFHKPPSKENLGIPFMRGLMKGSFRFVSGYSEKYTSWALKGKRRVKDFQLMARKIDELIKVGFNGKNEQEKGNYKVTSGNSDQLINAILVLAYSAKNEMQLAELEKAKVMRSRKRSYSVNDVLNRNVTNRMNRTLSRQCRNSGFSLKHEETIESTALRWYQCRVVCSGPEEYCRQLALEGVTLDPANISKEIRVCDEAIGYSRRNMKRKPVTRNENNILIKLKRLIGKRFKNR